jgi:hypothetical protein
MFAANATENLNVIDPCNRTGKITIPMTYVTETKGVSDFLRYAGSPPPDAKDLSLCLLFQKGRCNAGSRCNQVHATPEFVEQLRTRAQAAKSCCARHGDIHSDCLEKSKVVAVVADDGVSYYTLADFAFTPALELAVKRARAGVPVRVQATRLCRLHNRDSCKFGRDCKNLHLCPRAASQAAPAEPHPHVTMPVAMPVVAPVVPSVPPPLSGTFRPIDINTRCLDLSSRCVEPFPTPARSAAGDYGLDSSAARSTVKHLSVLSILNELSGLKRPDETDPLELLDNESSLSSAPDFDAFVDALVECELEPMASPQWLNVK